MSNIRISYSGMILNFLRLCASSTEIITHKKRNTGYNNTIINLPGSTCICACSTREELKLYGCAQTRTTRNYRDGEVKSEIELRKE